MEAEPDYHGDALLLAHVIDNELYQHCMSLIPASLRKRIKFLPTPPVDVRESIISKSVVINPSAYESFCLAAYEASQLGALNVLNGNNPAFGAGTPWVDGVNCVKFDGTTGGLVAVLREMWRQPTLLRPERVALPLPSEPYWLHAKERTAARSSPRSAGARLSLIVLVSDDFGDPIETLRSALLAGNLNMEIILVCDRAPSSPERSAALARIRESSMVSEGLATIVTLGFYGGTAALCNYGLRLAQGDNVAFARAGTSIDPAFLQDSVRALEAEPDYDIVVPQSMYVDAADERRNFVDAVRIGEALNSVYCRDNLFGPLEMVIRRPVAEAIGFDEALDRYVDWDFHLRACARGCRYIVSNRIEIRYDAGTFSGHNHSRSHFDAVLVKHGAEFPGGRVSLVSAVDATAMHVGNSKHDVIDENGIIISRRTLSYYRHDPKPWWKVALKRPTKVLRWLLLREFQIVGRKRR
jgi:hypothetical protein